MKRLGLGFLLCVGVAVGCSAASKTSTFGGDGGAGGESAGQGGAGPGSTSTGASMGQGGVGGVVFPTGSGGGAPGDTCSDAAKLIYVLSDANDLYSFDPPTKVFKKIGALGCQTSMSPNSMAVDRDATAWVNYVQSDPFSGTDSAGSIYKVSTKDASCEAKPAVQLPNHWYRTGMGFSTNGAGDANETLYVTGTSGQLGGGDAPGLGRIDMSAMKLVPIAQFSGTFAGQSAELTGTGDGRLYGYFTTSPVQVGEIDKTAATVKSPKTIPNLTSVSAWAFSFWGGDFYLYAASFGDSSVTRYRPSDNTIETYIQDVGFRIVGAGVSTCAPLEPPK